jgi:hypothetical protein
MPDLLLDHMLNMSLAFDAFWRELVLREINSYGAKKRVESNSS